MLTDRRMCPGRATSAARSRRTRRDRSPSPSLDPTLYACLVMLFVTDAVDRQQWGDIEAKTRKRDASRDATTQSDDGGKDDAARQTTGRKGRPQTQTHVPMARTARPTRASPRRPAASGPWTTRATVPVRTGAARRDPTKSQRGGRTASSRVWDGAVVSSTGVKDATR